MKKILICLLAVLMLGTLMLPAFAEEGNDTGTPTDGASSDAAATEGDTGEKTTDSPAPLSGDTASSDTAQSKKPMENRFMLGRNARQTSRTEGDFVALGDDTEVSRGVGGDVYTLGRNVLITDEKELHNVAAAGANVNVHVKTARNIYVAGGDVDVQADDGANGVYASGASVTLAGNIAEAYVAAGSVNVSGTVAENLTIRSNNIVFDPDTTVGGKITIFSKKHPTLPASIDPSRVTYKAPGAFGKTSEEGDITWRGTLRRLGAVLIVSGIVAAIALSLVLNAMRGAFFADKADTLKRRFWQDMLRGLAGVIIVPVLAVLLLFSVVGVPIGALVLVLYAVALYLAPIMTGVILGRRVFPRMNRFLSGAISVCAIWLLMLVPYLGAVVTVAAVIYGAGALISAIPPRERRNRSDGDRRDGGRRVKARLVEAN